MLRRKSKFEWKSQQNYKRDGQEVGEELMCIGSSHTPSYFPRPSLRYLTSFHRLLLERLCERRILRNHDNRRKEEVRIPVIASTNPQIF
jgi:hypothetical protein